MHNTRKKKTLSMALSVGLISLGMVGSADAALLGRLADSNGVYQAYYDDQANLTWLADANAGAGSAFDNAGSTTDGRMTWQNANAWAAQLTVGGVGGWRLASSDTCEGFYCTGSELGNLFYNVLGGVAFTSITATHNANYNLFSNVQSYGYWSAAEYAPNPSLAWGFGMGAGIQGGYDGNANPFYGWAVQSGDVSAVPVPAAAWLFGSGLLGLVGVARRKSANCL